MFLGLILFVGLWAIIKMIIVGLIIGIIAKAIMPGRDGGGFILTVLLGIAGSIVGGFFSSLVPWRVGEIGSYIMAVLGAIAILAVYRMITGRRSI